MKLPIELIPNTRPQKFRWKQTIAAPGGDRVVRHEGTVQASLELALVNLINDNKSLHKQLNEVLEQQKKEINQRVTIDELRAENEKLKLDNQKLAKQIEGHVDRIAAQSEIITKKAETPKKGK